MKRQTRGWILYDGSCGVCSHWVPFWGSTLARIGLDFAPLQSEWVAEKLAIPEEELLTDLRLLLEGGALISGADVYRYVMRRVWWGWPFYLLVALPGFRQLFDWAYRTFASQRFEVSKICRLTPETEREADLD